jgi:PIN domain nuclease of toxin-antitoxin system
MNKYVLDACALIALLDKEPGHEEIGHLLLRADSFALSTAICQQATIITADHHEFDKVEQNENINFLWIR